MIWFMVFQVVSTLVELVRLGRQSASEKDLEILLLRRQLAIYERKQDRPMRLSRGEKLPLVVLGTKLKTQTGRTIKALGDVIRIVKPKTLFQWPKQLVRLKWTTSGVEDRALIATSSSSCCAWRAKTTGDLSVLKGNYSNSGMRLAMKR